MPAPQPELRRPHLHTACLACSEELVQQKEFDDRAKRFSKQFPACPYVGSMGAGRRLGKRILEV